MLVEIVAGGAPTISAPQTWLEFRNGLMVTPTLEILPRAT